jgi:hypothetical protein
VHRDLIEQVLLLRQSLKFGAFLLCGNQSFHSGTLTLGDQSVSMRRHHSMLIFYSWFAPVWYLNYDGQSESQTSMWTNDAFYYLQNLHFWCFLWLGTLSSSCMGPYGHILWFWRGRKLKPSKAHYWLQLGMFVMHRTAFLVMHHCLIFYLFLLQHPST